jgi:hypothetical protein
VRKLLAFTRLYTTNETMVSEMGHVYRKLRECAPFQVRWCGVHHNISYIYIRLYNKHILRASCMYMYIARVHTCTQKFLDLDRLGMTLSYDILYVLSILYFHR